MLGLLTMLLAMASMAIKVGMLPFARLLSCLPAGLLARLLWLLARLLARWLAYCTHSCHTGCSMAAGT
jgi:hypothetical protein